MLKYISTAIFFSLFFLANANIVRAEANLPNTPNFPSNHLPEAGSAAKEFFTDDLIDSTDASEEYSSEEIFKKAPLKIDRSIKKIDKYRGDRPESILPAK